MTILDQVRALLVQGYWPSEIKDRIRSTNERTVRQYCHRIMASLSETEQQQVQDLRKRRPKPKGGVREFFERTPLGPKHIFIGSKIYYHRKLAQMNHGDFCEKYQFGNRVLVSTMEQGYHDFTLGELTRLSEILDMPLSDLLNPTLEVSHGL